MSDPSTFPMIPPDTLLANYDQQLAGDYTRIWPSTVALYFRRGVWQFTAVLAPVGQLEAEAVSVACLGQAWDADQTIWYLPAIDDKQEPWMADRFLLSLYLDRWGNRRLRRRSVWIGDGGTVIGVREWQDQPAEGRLVGVLSVPWEMGEMGDAAAILRVLRGRGHQIVTLDT